MNQSAVEKRDTRIRVTVVTGFLGSGKTTLLNSVLQHPSAASAAVIINELGEVGADHHLLRYAPGHVALIAGGCICCAVSGDLVATLRDLFMRALRREIPRFRHVLIEMTGLAMPSGVMFALRHDPFLAERYVVHGVVAVVDATHIQSQVSERPEVIEQLVAADRVVCSKVDLIDAGGLDVIIECVRRINPGARVSLQGDSDLVDAIFGSGSLVANESVQKLLTLWSRAGGVRSQTEHSLVRHEVLRLSEALPRALFLTRLSQFMEKHHDDVLRIKGIVQFESGAEWYAVHGVHGDLYPFESVAMLGQEVGYSWLVLIGNAQGFDQLVAELHQVLGVCKS